MPDPAPQIRPAGVPRPTPRLTTAQLMHGRREIIIEHGQEEYRLRITGTGKLLLTK
ncbi:MAG TPA: hemin uptake protein HemP [Stellaceae bacterium]|nr:hemin uptake protein HemP [Stellaceae bacterium]